MLDLLAQRPESDRNLIWRRTGDVSTSVPVAGEALTRKTLFSTCGQRMARYPVAGWLRHASGFIKRVSDSKSCEDEVGDKALGEGHQ